MAGWQFRKINPNDNSGISTVDDNFANEERSSVEILVRETLQNPLDARSDDELVRVRYNIVTLEKGASKFLDALFSEDCLKHLQSGRLLKDGKLPDAMNFLIVEDFGTTGLEGCYTDSSIDGPSENWNAFWFREGEGAKPKRSNGGAGQGKITLYVASAIRSVLALTTRQSDGKQLLFGCCRFKQNYKLSESTARWAKEARWGETKNSDDLVLPIENLDLIETVRSELGLLRDEKAGTSFIVPLPLGITLPELRRAVIDEFFFPIKRGRLEVMIGDLVLDKNSINAAAKTLAAGARYSADFRNFLENSIASHLGDVPTAVAKPNWVKSVKLNSECFDEKELANLKILFEKSGIVSVDFPVRIRKKDVAALEGRFRVVLRNYEDGDASQELFVRQDLGIDGEKRLAGSRRTQPVLALTFINDLELSAFLMSAEEPTHRTWNASRPKVMSMYDGTKELLNFVRNAALRLVEFLTPPGKRDNTALSVYFADPEAPKVEKRGSKGDIQDPKKAEPKEFPEIPPPKPRPIEIQSLTDGFVIKGIAGELVDKKFPLLCEVKTAYATTFGDPFKQWDAAEFWLNEEIEFPIKTIGISNIVRDGNEIRFFMEQPNSIFKLSGFDPNRKVEVQLHYREAEHAEDF